MRRFGVDCTMHYDACYGWDETNGVHLMHDVYDSMGAGVDAVSDIDAMCMAVADEFDPYEGDPVRIDDMYYWDSDDNMHRIPLWYM